MNCPHCNTRIPDEALFCPNCGKAVSDTQTDKTATAGIAADSYSNNPYRTPEYRDQYQNNSAGNRQVLPAYPVSDQTIPAGNRQIPPGYSEPYQADPEGYRKNRPEYYEPVQINPSHQSVFTSYFSIITHSVTHSYASSDILFLLKTYE